MVRPPVISSSATAPGSPAVKLPPSDADKEAGGSPCSRVATVSPPPRAPKDSSAGGVATRKPPTPSLDSEPRPGPGNSTTSRSPWSAEGTPRGCPSAAAMLAKPSRSSSTIRSSSAKTSPMSPSTRTVWLVPPVSTSTMRAVIRSWLPRRWYAPATSHETPSSRATSRATASFPASSSASYPGPRSRRASRPMTERVPNCSRSVVTVSAIPAASQLSSGSPEILAKGTTATVRGRNDTTAGASSTASPTPDWAWRGPAPPAARRQPASAMTARVMNLQYTRTRFTEGLASSFASVVYPGRGTWGAPEPPHRPGAARS